VVEADYLRRRHRRPQRAGVRPCARQLDRKFPDAFGSKRTIDALLIDSGYRTHIVYSFVRKHQRVHPLSGQDVVLATKGIDGWGKPAIGQPKLVDIDLAGKTIKQGVKVWGLGTWPLKSEHYANLHKVRESPRPAPRRIPMAFAIMAPGSMREFFKQITAEYLAEIRFAVASPAAMGKARRESLSRLLCRQLCRGRISRHRFNHGRSVGSARRDPRHAGRDDGARSLSRRRRCRRNAGATESAPPAAPA
jgi:phage terminase large subunit GpA-like protein